MIRMGALAWAAHALAVLLALLLALVAVPLAAGAMVFAVAQQLTGPAIYKEAFAAQRLYERLPELAAAQVSAQLSYVPKDQEPQAGNAEGGAPAAFRSLGPAEWEVIVREVVPPDWLRAQTERALDQLLADPPPTGPVLVSIAELKAHVIDGAGVRAYLTLARAQPACSAAEIAAWAAGTGQLPRCRPPEDVLTAATPALQEGLVKVLGDLPDEVDLRGTTGPAPENGESGGGLDLAKLRTIVRIGILAPLVPAVLIVLLVVRSRRGLRWLGMPLLLSALLALGLSVVAVPGVDQLVTREVAKAPAYWSPVLLGAVHDLALEVIGALALRLALLSILVGASATAVLIFATRRTAPSLRIAGPTAIPAAAGTPS